MKRSSVDVKVDRIRYSILSSTVKEEVLDRSNCLRSVTTQFPSSIFEITFNNTSEIVSPNQDASQLKQKFHVQEISTSVGKISCLAYIVTVMTDLKPYTIQQNEEIQQLLSQHHIN